MALLDELRKASLDPETADHVITVRTLRYAVDRMEKEFAPAVIEPDRIDAENWILVLDGGDAEIESIPVVTPGTGETGDTGDAGEAEGG